jgi:hypothetical protein
MSEQKQGSGRPENRPGNTGRRARIEDVAAVGEVLDEQGLRLVAGGMIPVRGTSGCTGEDCWDPIVIGF